jgi:hypothetical protein
MADRPSAPYENFSGTGNTLHCANRYVRKMIMATIEIRILREHHGTLAGRGAWGLQDRAVHFLQTHAMHPGQANLGQALGSVAAGGLFVL